MNSKIIAFAIEAHHNTNHLYDSRPYSSHLAIVAFYAMKYMNKIPSIDQETVLHACWLHDTIEDCRLTYNDIKEFAGEQVADIVYAVTNLKGKSRSERANDKYYEGIRNTLYAVFVKLCDRLANVKYGKDNNSLMLKIYKKENEEFLNKLFFETDKFYYRDMIRELNELLS